MLDVSACLGEPNCPGIWNPFADNTLTPAMADYITVNDSPVSRARLLQFDFNLSGDFLAFELLGGKPLRALGYEHRSEKASSTPDGAAKIGEIYYASSEITSGQYTTNEVFTEITFPLLNGITGVYDLSFDFATRYTKYDSLDPRFSNKYALNYAPIEGLRFRYTYAEGFRAANISERFSPRTQTAPQYTDPCSLWSKSDDPILRANCQADGLPRDFNVSQEQATGLTGGNPDLNPETSVSQTIGVIITPYALQNFSATFDLFAISIDDAIGEISTDEILASCYASPNFSSPFCAYLLGPNAVGATPSPVSPRRDISNLISGQSLLLQNLSTFKTQCLDFSANYAVTVRSYLLTANLIGTWLFTYKYKTYEKGDWVSLAGKYGADPTTESSLHSIA